MSSSVGKSAMFKIFTSVCSFVSSSRLCVFASDSKDFFTACTGEQSSKDFEEKGLSKLGLVDILDSKLLLLLENGSVLKL